MLRKQTLTRESAERALGMRSVKHEWGVNVIDDVHTGVYTVRCTRNGHDNHGHGSQPNTLRLTPSTAREARSERLLTATAGRNSS